MMPMSFSVLQIDHVEVFVRDLEVAAKWYGELLGLRVIHRWDPEPIFLGVGGTALALFLADGPKRGKPADASATSEPYWHRVAWRTTRDGFDAAQRHLAERGIVFRGPIDHDIAWSIYFSDPDGNPLEITYYV